VELRRSSHDRLCLLSWSDEFAPSAGDDRLQLRGLTPVPLLTFACCLSLCWDNPEQPPYPGVETSERGVLAAARRLTSAETHVKSALRHGLVSVGLLEYDHATRAVRLGPEVAAFSESEVASLQRISDLLPKAEGRS
jgi:hypothetical protein